MKNQTLVISQRVAKSESRMGYKIGTISKISGNKGLASYDNFPSRWVNIENLEIIHE